MPGRADFLVVDAVLRNRSPISPFSLVAGKRAGNSAKICASHQILLSNSLFESITCEQIP
jgi:hypothetical protein